MYQQPAQCKTWGRAVLRRGDVTTPCKKCGKTSVIVDSLPAMKWHGIPIVLHGAEVRCGGPPGTHWLIAPVERPSPATLSETAQPPSTPQSSLAAPGSTPGSSQSCVFAKSCVSVSAGLTGVAPVAHSALNVVLLVDVATINLWTESLGRTDEELVTGRYHAHKKAANQRGFFNSNNA